MLGRSFEAALLDDVVGEPVDDADVLEELARHLEPEGTGRLRFRHALVRDAAYEGLSYKRRRELHTRAGEAIERRAGDRTDEHAELLSLHFFEAGRHDAAWRYACIGAEHANEVYANVEAAALYHRALASGRRAGATHRPSSPSIYESLGDVQDRIGVYDDAVASYRAAAQAAARRPAGAGPHDRQGSARRRAPGPLLELGALDPQGSAPARRPTRRRGVAARAPSST